MFRMDSIMLCSRFSVWRIFTFMSEFRFRFISELFKLMVVKFWMFGESYSFS